MVAKLQCMKYIGFLLSLMISCALIYLLEKPIKGNLPYGRLLSPTEGFMQNASADKLFRKKVKEKIKTPYGNVNLFIDEYDIPHLFANSQKALYYAQGYLVASDRLWQMEFLASIAEGRLSEKIGEDGINIDRFFRRMGIKKIAERTVQVFKDDELSNIMLSSFTDGVNAYIKQLSRRDFPVEYKLLDYRPEMWSNYKSVLIMKLMAFRLTGGFNDIVFSNIQEEFGRAVFDELFPRFPKDADPIIPAKTRWKFKPVVLMDTFNQSGISSFNPITHDPYPQKGLGSNNWALNGDKTASGSPILCNDPHLGLSFPSIWYQMQLNGPDLNVYGVTIPGGPGITIGFNDSIGWGVTNGSWDVWDIYEVDLKNHNEYFIGNNVYTYDVQIEKIKVKNAAAIYDTVRWTEIGPVLYDKHFGKHGNKPLVLNWQALEVSNELKTFYYLNKANNHEDYLKALDYYECPAQNFVYADVNNNIAIKQQGKFKLKPVDRGLFVGNTSDFSLNQLNTYIPSEHNPYVLNPKRDFVSSANQHPTDERYPYYYRGLYEEHRNRRINDVLKSSDNVTMEDMMQLQNDNYSLLAAEILPELIEITRKTKTSNRGKTVLAVLEEWDFMMDHEKKAPAYFQYWWNEIMLNTWDEFIVDTSGENVMPSDKITCDLIKENKDYFLFDNKQSDVFENSESIIRQAFKSMITYFGDHEDSNWQSFKNTRITHLTELEGFSTSQVPIGGYRHIVNACAEDWGPSWRMIVSLEKDNVTGYGIYPGGQSGNPGSKRYDTYVDQWAAGKYNPFLFFNTLEKAEQYIQN